MDSHAGSLVRFLLDVCVSWRSLEASLAHLGDDVISARGGALPALACKDFGELVFVRRQPQLHPYIVRFVGKVVAMHEMPWGRMRIRTKRRGDKGEE